MSEANPFASPKAPSPRKPLRRDDNSAPSDDIQLIKGKLVGKSPIILPEICVKCGADAHNGKRFEKSLYYCNLLFFLTILINILVLIIVYFVARKKIDLSFSLCENCLIPYKRKRMVAALFWLATILSVVAGIALESSEFIIVFVILLIAAIVMNIVAGLPLRPSGHSKGLFTIKGAKQPFFDRFFNNQETA